MEPNFERMYWKIVHLEDKYRRNEDPLRRQLIVQRIRRYIVIMSRMENALRRRHKPIPLPNPYRIYY
jgi:hypothetical protein